MGKAIATELEGRGGVAAAATAVVHVLA